MIISPLSLARKLCLSGKQLVPVGFLGELAYKEMLGGPGACGAQERSIPSEEWMS